MRAAAGPGPLELRLDGDVVATAPAHMPAPATWALQKVAERERVQGEHAMVDLAVTDPFTGTWPAAWPLYVLLHDEACKQSAGLDALAVTAAFATRDRAKVASGSARCIL